VKRQFVILILTLLIIPVVKAEYRVYQYMVSSAFPLNQDSASYVVTSSLSPMSYVAYHGGEDVIRVSLLRSWICMGNTGHSEAPCQAPLENFESSQEIGADSKVTSPTGETK